MEVVFSVSLTPQFVRISISTHAKPHRMRVVDALRALQKTYPATFKRLSEKRVPLKVGILDDIIADGGGDAVFPEDMPPDERRASLKGDFKGLREPQRLRHRSHQRWPKVRS